MKNKDDEEDKASAGSDENRDERAESMTWDLHDLKSGDCLGVVVLQAIGDFCIK